MTSLSPVRRQLFSRLLKEKGITTAEKRAIPQCSRSCPIPLSFAQQRLWFLDQLTPGNPAYNDCYGVHFNGSLHVATLEQALNEIIRRHESLRTNFRVVEGQPVQVIAKALTLKLPVVDIGELPDMEREAEIHRLATEETYRPFDLAQRPLLRVRLLRLSPEEHVLLLIIHHIISDGLSFIVFFRELGTLYEAFSAGKSSPLLSLSLQYADFAVWEQQFMMGEVLESQLSYWKQQLGGPLPVLELATDRPRPAVQTFRGTGWSWEIPKSLIEELKALNRQQNVTSFMVLLATFQTLLHCYTGQEDILVGFPIANHKWGETEGLIGFFVNTLPLRANLSGNPSFRGLLGRVRQATLDAYTHRDLPFEKLVESLKLERDLSRNPLFQVFIVQHTVPEALKLPGLTLKHLNVENGIAKFDLSLWMIEEAEDLILHLRYNTDLFNATTIARMLEHFKRLLRHIVARPDARLKELKEILTEADRKEQIVKRKERKVSASQKLKNIRRKPITIQPPNVKGDDSL